MLKDAQRRKFDVIMAWAIDRLGRSLIDLLGTIQVLEACCVDLYLDQQSIDTTTPAGKLMFQVCGAFAEFERSMIRQRVYAGLKRAVAQGKQLGRPRIDAAIEKRIQGQLRTGKGILKVARELGAGSGTVQRIKQEGKGQVSHDADRMGGLACRSAPPFTSGYRPISKPSRTKSPPCARSPSGGAGK